ncbi:hypothetical protein P7K49_001649 [Saguinus oedipus]|uniref:Uncharacterized protein n=1 Tax=Saguinus oedipus TaxID=9490 RepID=A0ABQ9WHL1_SAGOE|nr:hypothetical protein P7K49_001649 [Saguinus oedipus]
MILGQLNKTASGRLDGLLAEHLALALPLPYITSSPQKAVAPGSMACSTKGDRLGESAIVLPRVAEGFSTSFIYLPTDPEQRLVGESLPTIIITLLAFTLVGSDGSQLYVLTLEEGKCYGRPLSIATTPFSTCPTSPSTVSQQIQMQPQLITSAHVKRGLGAQNPGGATEKDT